ncbi:MAG: hypothetical protein ACI8W7_005053, partial [Gammaproteobacteria bacterium]
MLATTERRPHGAALRHLGVVRIAPRKSFTCTKRQQQPELSFLAEDELRFYRESHLGSRQECRPDRRLLTATQDELASANAIHHDRAQPRQHLAPGVSALAARANSVFVRPHRRARWRLPAGAARHL